MGLKITVIFYALSVKVKPLIDMMIRSKFGIKKIFCDLLKIIISHNLRKTKFASRITLALDFNCSSGISLSSSDVKDNSFMLMLGISQHDSKIYYFLY